MVVHIDVYIKQVFINSGFVKCVPRVGDHIGCNRNDTCGYIMMEVVNVLHDLIFPDSEYSSDGEKVSEQNVRIVCRRIDKYTVDPEIQQ